MHMIFLVFCLTFLCIQMSQQIGPSKKKGAAV